MIVRTIDSLPNIDVTPRCTLNHGDIHIWYVCYDNINDSQLLARYQALMSDDERHRHGRFVFARDRRQFLITRALVRTTLSRYAPVAPADWRFVCNEYGKPQIAYSELSTAHDVPRLSFNLSNTRGLIACAVTANQVEIGVDVEDIDRPGASVEIADRFFSAAEVDALQAVPAARQTQRFFMYWTLKEAYIKARGMGLSIPLEQFSLHLDSDADIRISFDPRLDDVAEEWQFDIMRVSGRHLLALAVRCGRHAGQARPSLRAARCVPLVERGSPAPGSHGSHGAAG